MLAMDVGDNLGSVIGNLTEIEEKHVPFALSLALNRTAKDVQVEVVSGLASQFTLRRNWTAKGIRLTPATKGSLVARIYTKDWYMRDQEEGGDRRPRNGNDIWVPTLAVRDGGVLSGLVRRNMRPRALRKAADEAAAKLGATGKRHYRQPGEAYAKPTPFIAVMKNGKRGLFIRQDSSRRLPLTLLYTLAPDVKIAPRWHFQATGNRISAKRLRQQFIDALSHALDTAKGGAVHSSYVSELKRLSAYSGGSASGGNMLSGGLLSMLER